MRGPVRVSGQRSGEGPGEVAGGRPLHRWAARGSGRRTRGAAARLRLRTSGSPLRPLGAAPSPAKRRPEPARLVGGAVWPPRSCGAGQRPSQRRPGCSGMTSQHPRGSWPHATHLRTVLPCAPTARGGCASVYLCLHVSGHLPWDSISPPGPSSGALLLILFL